MEPSLSRTEPRGSIAAKPPAVLRWRRGLSGVLWPVLTLPADAAAVVASFYFAYKLRFSTFILSIIPVPGAVPTWAAFARDLPALVILWLFLFHYSAELYKDEEQPLEDRFLGVAKGCVFGIAATFALGFLYHRFENSRLMVLLALPTSVVLVLVERELLRALHVRLLHILRGELRALVLGGGKTADMLKRRLQRPGQMSCESLPRATLPEILNVVETRGISQVLLAQMNLGKADLLRLSEECEKRGVDLRIVPGLLEMRMGEVQIDESLGLPTFRIYHAQFSGANFAAKRLFDLAFCAVFFAVFALPIALICLLIKLDSRGPILFRQKRVGYKGKEFGVFKFRTMVTDAEQRLDALKHLNERQGPVFKMKNDPRITGVGRWLRRFSLDEVPQFLNVVAGDMSVVGPRPPLPREVAQYDETALKRLNVLPGITGLGQVSGRADLDFNQQVALDLYYLEHWSPGLDLKIILKTPAAVLSSKGAY